MTEKNTQPTYIEMPSSDLAATKLFYTTAFGWQFEDFGKEYTTIVSDEIRGGFIKNDSSMRVKDGSALVVLYREDLVALQEQILVAGGKIVVETFSFPGGSRFHFEDTTGNELAVWSREEQD